MTGESNVALVVGAAGGIGRASCARLASRAVRLVLASRDAARLVASSDELGGEVAPLDACDLDAFGVLVSGVIERHGRFDAAVNHADVGEEAWLEASEAMHPLGRIGESDDVTRMIDLLLHPAPGWVTGQTFGVDRPRKVPRPA